MENNILVIQLKPDYNATAEKLGYDIEREEVNEEAVLFQQGYDMIEIEIESGENFTISDEFESGTISCDEINYKLIKQDMFYGDKEIEIGKDTLLLKPGNYLYHTDGITIEQLKITDYDTYDDDNL